MSWLVSRSLHYAPVLLVLAFLGGISGFFEVGNIPLDVFPEFAPPVVEIQTEAPGLSTPEVEQAVSVPIESALSGIPSVDIIRSKSVLGLSSVVLILERGTNLMETRQIVQERLSRLTSSLPTVAHAPVMLSPLSSLSRVLKIGVTSSSLSQVQLTTLIRWTVRPQLMAIPGVANVAIWGQRDRQLQVLIDSDRLAAHNVTIDQVLGAARDAVAVETGGFLDTANQRLAISHVAAITSAEDLGRVVVTKRQGGTLRLGDVATIAEGHQAPIGDAIINDVPGLLLIVEKQPGANTLEVTRGVEEALNRLRPALPGVEMDSTIFRPATFIEMSLANLNRALLIGCILVVIVLIVFLEDWRTALISAVAIPLSLIAAGLILRYRGGTIDTMVLAGLVIALGEVVDDAIIDVENIVRRLRLNRALPEPRPVLDVIFHASLEVRSAVVYGSLIVVVVFIPVLMLEGLSGAFFRPLATSYILAIMSSLFVALTVTPAMALMLLPGHETARDPRVVRWLKARYGALLPRLIRRPSRAMFALAGLLLLTAVSTPLLGEEFLPNFREYDFLMHWVEKPGTSLKAMTRITERASKELRTIPGVRNFGSHIGRAEVADEVVGPNFTELWISLDPEVPYEATVAKVQAVVDGYPGLYRDLLTYLRERIKEVLTGASATIVVRTYGPDFAALQGAAAQVRGVMSQVDGVIDLKVQAQVLVPQIEVRFRPERAEVFGLTPGDVRRATTTMMKGTKVGAFVEDQRFFDVVVWGTPDTRANLESVRALRIPTPGGGTVPLTAVADVQVMPVANEITRENGSRRIDVTCNVRGRDLGSVARDIEAKLAGLPLGAGYHAEVLGESAARAASSRKLMMWGFVALGGILLILMLDFNSIRLTLLVFLTLPFALVGAIAAAFLTGGVLSLGSLVGLVTVVGIAARNGIMLVSHYRHLEREEGMTFGPELIIRGAEERLAPILMTALATGLALVPIALSGDKPGHEIEHPLAVVILGGLVTSTVLNLFLMPPLYLKFGKTRSPATGPSHAPPGTGLRHTR
ncbi:MAG: efflux RND transporter permease subunit [Vicinamibacterales bacterium]